MPRRSCGALPIAFAPCSPSSGREPRTGRWTNDGTGRLQCSWTSRPTPARAHGSTAMRSPQCGAGVRRTRRIRHGRNTLLEAVRVVESRAELGRMPGDLAETVALAALASPATTAARALARTIGDAGAAATDTVRDAAASVSWTFRTLFNLPEATGIVRAGCGDAPYWRTTLEYCLSGNSKPCWTNTRTSCVKALASSTSPSARSSSRSRWPFASRCRFGPPR